MIAHLRALSLIQIVRFAVGLALGIALIWSSNPENIPAERHSRLEPHDLTLFLAAGSVLVVLALLRGGQGALVLLSIHFWRRGMSFGSFGAFLRKMGIALAAVDLIDIIAFPITTGCGAYGLLIYRHPDIRDFFEGVFSGRRQSESLPPQASSLKPQAYRP